MKYLNFAISAIVLLISTGANAALIGRDLDGNLTTAEAYYDDQANLTWLADANYAQTSGYAGADSIGRMNGWTEANNWASGLDMAGVTGWRLANADRDRKSTRLNSSHITISYADFCLKKKKSTLLSCYIEPDYNDT